MHHFKVVWNSTDKYNGLLSCSCKKQIHFCEYQTWNIPGVSYVIKGMTGVSTCMLCSSHLQNLLRCCTSNLSGYLILWAAAECSDWFLLLHIQLKSSFTPLKSGLVYIWHLEPAFKSKTLCRYQVHLCCSDLNLCLAADLRKLQQSKKGTGQEPWMRADFVSLCLGANHY